MVIPYSRLGPRSSTRAAFMVGTALLFAVAVRAETILVRGLDSPAIEAAIEQSKPGDTVSLPEGTYAITGAIQPKSRTQFVGAGQDKTFVRFVGDKPSVMVRLANCEDVEVAHLTLDGQGNLSVLQGISAGNARRLTLHHLTIRDLAKTKTFGPHGILFTGRNPTRKNGVTDSVIADCTLENIGVGAKFGGGIRLAWGSSRNQVLRCTIRNTGRGGIFTNNGSTDTIIRGNVVDGSGGTGLGIEVHSGGDRSVIEDNRIDHWLSVGGCDFCALRRNIVDDEGGTTKSYGLEIIGSYCVVTDNEVDHGQGIGISVSAKMPKNYHFYARNTIRACYHWAVQLQGEKGGIAYHYFYRCKFLDTLTGHHAVRYKGYEGHGFRTNGNVNHVVLEECECSRNGRYGVQLGGGGVDFLSFVRCTIRGNKGAAVTGPHEYTSLEWRDCTIDTNASNKLPPEKPFAHPAPMASFSAPAQARVGQPVQFLSTSKAAHGETAAALWDFNDGVPAIEPDATHIFRKPGEYRVTLIVWDSAGRGARAEKLIRVTD